MSSHHAEQDVLATAREDVVDVVHGHVLADPYRWLEAPASDARVRAFVATQDGRARSALAALPAREAFIERLRGVWDHPRRSAPWRRGSRWFQFRNDGLQDQDVLFSAPAHPEDARTTLPSEEAWAELLDPNAWSEDGTVALSGLAISPDGSRAAVGRATAGSDWTTWRVLEVADGRLRDDVVPWSKFAGATWLPDGSAFLCTTYDAPAPGSEHAAATRDQRVVLHRVGTSADDDVLVHHRPDQPEWGFHPEISHDGRWLILTITRGTDPATRVHVAPVDEGGTIGTVRALLDDGEAGHHPLGVYGDELLVLTDLGAPLGRIIAVDLAGGRVREVVGQRSDRLVDAHLLGGATPNEGGWLVLHHLHHATARLEVVDPADGTPRGTVPLPWPVTVNQLTGGRHDDTLHLAVGSFTAPDRVLACDLPGLAVQDVWQALPADGPPVVVEQLRIHHDGVAVPLFVVHREDVQPDGLRPTMLWGYGGFDIPVTPMHRPGWRAWVDAGGVLAVACLRGGGEYGRTWHDDGRLANKQHVFDDALACAAWLTGQRRGEVSASALSEGSRAEVTWSAPTHLGIEGRSNGGLLVGACLTQAPEAFGAAVPEVGVLDLTRFHRFTIGWAWTSDYGSPDDPDDLETLLAYSPYHNLEVGRSYPATLLTTGDTDDRVVPAHSYKF
ncbi:MAG: prolyl oligopeptidase family serine peptidase, partial [Nitriliruptoraceae bacterium]